MHEPIEDGISDGAITQEGVPLIHRHLAGDQCGFAIVADFPQIAHAPIAQGREPEVITGQQVDARKLPVESGALLLAP